MGHSGPTGLSECRDFLDDLLWSDGVEILRLDTDVPSNAPQLHTTIDGGGVWSKSVAEITIDAVAVVTGVPTPRPQSVKRVLDTIARDFERGATVTDCEIGVTPRPRGWEPHPDHEAANRRGRRSVFADGYEDARVGAVADLATGVHVDLSFTYVCSA